MIRGAQGCDSSQPRPDAQHINRRRGDTTVSATDEINPRKPPITAPRVVQFLLSTDVNSTGKLAEAATAKAGNIMRAMFLLLESDAKHCCGGTSIDLVSDRAIVQTKMTISPRRCAGCPLRRGLHRELLRLGREV